MFHVPSVFKSSGSGTMCWRRTAVACTPWAAKPKKQDWLWTVFGVRWTLLGVRRFVQVFGGPERCSACASRKPRRLNGSSWWLNGCFVEEVVRHERMFVFAERRSMPVLQRSNMMFLKRMPCEVCEIGSRFVLMHLRWRLQIDVGGLWRSFRKFGVKNKVRTQIFVQSEHG